MGESLILQASLFKNTVEGSGCQVVRRFTRNGSDLHLPRLAGRPERGYARISALCRLLIVRHFEDTHNFRHFEETFENSCTYCK